MKLAAAASDLPKLQRALLDLAPGSAASCSSLTTTCYDTADRALLRHGLSLRVREAAGRFVQTVKIAEPRRRDRASGRGDGSRRREQAR